MDTQSKTIAAKLRPSQKKALLAMADAFINKKTTKRGLVVLPTGAGKTFTAAFFNLKLIKQLGLKIIWVAHREELLAQAAKAHLDIDSTLSVTYWNADSKDIMGDIVVVSIQSSPGIVEALLSVNEIDSNKYVLVIDEAHHHAANDGKYSNNYGKLEESLFSHGLIRFAYGLTATAVRLDGRKLGYDSVVYQMNFIDGVNEGILARPRYYEMRTNQEYHIDTVMKEDGKRDYTESDLKQLNNPLRNLKIAQEYIRNKEWMTAKDGSFILDKDGNKQRGWGKTMLFAINVQHCYDLAEVIKKEEPSIDIRIVSGSSSSEEREEAKKWLSEGDIHSQKLLINCQIFTEGYDEPSINSIFLTRPTKSEALWLQMAGRGARIQKDDNGKSIKDTFNLVSIMDEIGRYGALVKEWEVSLVNDQNEAKNIKKRNIARGVEKKRRYKEIIDTANAKELVMSDAEFIDVQAILICCTKNTTPLGIPLDRDRIDCIRLLKEYMPNCYKKNENNIGIEIMELDIDSYRSSYSHCVPANEFDHETWRKIAWAYYFKYYRNLDKVVNAVTKKVEPVWKLIPLVPIDEISSDEANKSAEDRISKVKENTVNKNTEFNTAYSSASATRELYEYVLDAISQEDPTLSLFVSDNCVKVKAQDRLLEAILDTKIVDHKDPNLKLIKKANKLGTEILQTKIQDSVAEFRCSPRG